MKIIFITSKLNFQTSGGSVFDIDRKARSFLALGNSVKCVTAFSKSNLIPGPQPYQIIEENIIKTGLVEISWAVYKILKKYEKEADFFHVDGHVFLYGAGLYKRLGGRVPIVAFFNRELGSFSRDVPVYEFGLADEDVANTFLKKLKKCARLIAEKSIGMLLANAIEITTFTSPILQMEYNKFGLEAKYQLISPECGEIFRHGAKRTFNQKPLQLIAVGRLIPTKGFDLLIYAFSLRSSQDEYHLTIAGSGADEARLKKMSKEFGLEKRITFSGWLSRAQLFEILDSSDIFIVPRWRRELTSVGLIEAMSRGLPSIVSAGSATAWQAGSAAVVFKFDDPQNLALAIQKLSDDKNLLEQLSENAYKRISELRYTNWTPQLYATMKQIKY